MKFLETRTEIAKAINFKQYPTIRIDVSETDDYGIVGTHVLIDNGTFRDEGCLVLKTGARVDPHCQTPLTLEKFMAPGVIGGN